MLGKFNEPLSEKIPYLMSLARGVKITRGRFRFAKATSMTLKHKNRKCSHYEDLIV